TRKEACARSDSRSCRQAECAARRRRYHLRLFRGAFWRRFQRNLGCERLFFLELHGESDGKAGNFGDRLAALRIALESLLSVRHASSIAEGHDGTETGGLLPQHGFDRPWGLVRERIVSEVQKHVTSGERRIRTHFGALCTNPEKPKTQR